MQNIFWGLETKISLNINVWKMIGTQTSSSRKRRHKNEVASKRLWSDRDQYLPASLSPLEMQSLNLQDFKLVKLKLFQIFEFDQFELFYIFRYIYNVIHTYNIHCTQIKSIFIFGVCYTQLYTTITMILIIISSSKIAIFKFGISHLSGKFKCSC